MIDNSNKYLKMLAYVLGGGIILYIASVVVLKMKHPGAVNVANPYFAYVKNWAESEANPERRVSLLQAIDQATNEELNSLHTIIAECWNKGIDPYIYFMDEAHTKTIGQWWMEFQAKYRI